ncbi:MAG TPA: autotransporter-associated beta strand repeat-containing protein, partial [Rariglobus sp.]
MNPDRALKLNIDSGFSTSISINATGYSLTELAFSALTASADVTISLGLWNGTTTTALEVDAVVVSGSSMTTYAFDLDSLYLENDQIDLVLTYTAADGTLLTIDNVQILGVVYDPATGLLVIWRGGDGTWGASPASTAWTNQSGATNGAWSGGAAIFGGTAGTVTVSTADGPVTFTGAKFQTTGYTIAGGALTTETADTELSVVADATATISAPITGTGGIDKTDLGTLVLSGASTYAGATAVSAGTLFIDGDQSAATGAVSVADGATLGGSGTTGGIVTVASGGTLLGVQGRTFTMAGLVLNATSHLDVTLGAPGASGLFQVSGDLTLDGLLDITATAGFGVGVYRLIDYTGALTDNGLDLGITPDGVPLSNLAVQTTVANQVNLVFEAVSRNFWNGGSGTWSADPSGSAWTNFDGTDTGAWAPDVAIFQGTAGTVTVDASFGAVVFTGIQFASDGWTVTGGVLTTDTADTALRVGDGTQPGAAYTATLESVIAGSGGLNKTDLGTAILTGDNTYT